MATNQLAAFICADQKNVNVTVECPYCQWENSIWTWVKNFKNEERTIKCYNCKSIMDVAPVEITYTKGTK